VTASIPQVFVFILLELSRSMQAEQLVNAISKMV